MSKMTCPKCHAEHELIGPVSFAYFKSTGEIVILDGYSLIDLNRLNKSRGDLIDTNGPVFYCDKIGKYIAIGSTKVVSSPDEISGKAITF